MSRRILVTGGSGMVGAGIKWAVEQDKTNENDVWLFASSKHADLMNYQSTKSLFERFKPTHVIHLAANVGGLYKNMNNKLSMLKTNMAINDNVLTACYEFKVKKCVSALSTCILPDKTTYPIDETMLHLGEPHKSNYGYAFAKRFIDVENRVLTETTGSCYTAVIPCNVYGPGDNYSPEDSHVIPGLIQKVFKAKNDGTAFTIWGTGKPLRQFIYSRDLGRIFLWALNEYEDSVPIIAAPDEEEEISIKDVAKLIMEAMDFNGQVLYDTTKADGQFKKTASNAKLRKYLTDFQFTPIEKALHETVDDFVGNYPNVKGIKL